MAHDLPEQGSIFVSELLCFGHGDRGFQQARCPTILQILLKESERNDFTTLRGLEASAMTGDKL